MAQQTPAVSNADTQEWTDEETVVLSPFEVTTSKDKGYKATNATSGTRLNTPIKDVPLNLEVITNDFLRDTGAKSLREGLRYSAGVVLESQADAFAEDDDNVSSAGANDPRGVTRRAGESTTKLRGFVIDQVLRDGFRRQYSADWTNIGRVEVLRGPSALLYGVGSLGGVINYMPKLPEREEKTYIGTSIGSHGLYRGEFDVTGPMGTGSWRPAYRVTGAYQERGDYTEHYRARHWTISPVFSFNPFKNTTILIDNEFGESKQFGVGFQNIRSNIGNQAAAPGRNAEWLTDISNGLINTRTFRWSGPDTYLQGPFRNTIIDVTQRVGEDLFIKLGVAQSESRFDSRQIKAGVAPGTLDGASLPISTISNYYEHGTTMLGGTSYNIRDAITQALANGDFNGYSIEDIYNNRSMNSYRADRLYGFVREGLFNKVGTNTGPQVNDRAMIWYQWQDENVKDLRDQVRFDATYNVDAGSLGRHTFIVGAQYMKLKKTRDEYGPAYGYTNRTTQVPVSVQNWERFNFKNPQDYSAFRYGAQGDGVQDVPMYHLYNTVERNWDLGYYGVYQGQFFNDRVTLIGGARWDRSDARTVRTFLYEQGRNPSISGRGTEGTTGDVPTATSPQIGLSIKITDDISVFGVYSEGVVPNPYAADGNGNMLKPTKAKNKEVGVKFDLADGRISGTVSAYEIKRTGTPKLVWWAPNPWKSREDGWDETKPNAVLGGFATPEAMWAVIHGTEGLNTAQGLELAKRIWSPGWHALLDEISGVSDVANAGAGPEGSRFWTWDNSGYAYAANTNTENYDPNYSGDLWFPLFNLSDPDVVKAFDAISALPGWKGNYYTDGGKTFRWADGSAGYTNGPGSSGAFVPMNDQARGWDASVIFTPNDSLQILLNYAHVKRKVTSRTYQFVSLGYWPAGWWMQKDQNFGTFGQNRSPQEAYEDVNDTATYRVVVPDYNQPMDDTPENTANVWVRYNFDATIPALKGWTVGLGGQWEDKRLWFSGFGGGGGNIVIVDGSTDGADPNNLVKFYTKERYSVNLLVEYRTRVADKYNVRVALNADNLLDDQGRYGLVYGSGSSYRLSLGVDF